MSGLYIIALALLITLILANFPTLGNAARDFGNQFNPEITDSFPAVNDTKLKVEMIAKGLNFPSNMAFLDQDDILVTEKNNGTVQRIINGSIQPEPLLDLNVATRAERGLLGIAVSEENNVSANADSPRNVYLYFTKSAIDGDSNGTARGEKTGGNHVFKYDLVDSKLTNAVQLLNLSKHKGFAHNGGALIIDLNRNLYIPIGDADGYTNSTNFSHHNTEAQNIIDGGPPDSTEEYLLLQETGKHMQIF